MRTLWEDRAWDDYLYWQSQDKKTLKRINTLIKDIKRNPFDGIGKPEPLKEVNIMCNLGEGLVERTEQRTRLDSVINLMKSLKLSAEEAINAIGVPAEDRKSLLEMLDKRMAAK